MRPFNESTSNEVAIFMVGDLHDNRDIFIHARDNNLKRLSETHPSYDVLYYSLILCNGQDGYRSNISQIQSATVEPITNKKMSSGNFYYYQLMLRLK